MRSLPLSRLGVVDPSRGDVIGYRLELHIHTSVHHDRIEIEAESLDDLKHKLVDVGGHTFERYGDPDDYIEVRPSDVVMRTVTKIYEIKQEGHVKTGRPSADTIGGRDG